MGVKVSDRAVRRRLVNAGLRARIARKKPFVNVVQRQKRVAWAKEHVTWTAEDWKKVIFSDETRTSEFGSDGVRYVRRRPGEDCLPECSTPTMKHPDEARLLFRANLVMCLSVLGVVSLLRPFPVLFSTEPVSWKRLNSFRMPDGVTP